MSADATFWDKLAEKYSRRPVANPEAFERKIEVTKKLMGPQAEVLDIGCGTGSLALRLAPFGARVHGDRTGLLELEIYELDRVRRSQE